jgi:hypothetical protein
METLFTKFYQTEDGQPYNHANYRSEFLETTDGVQRLIVEMEELKEMEDGMVLENRFYWLLKMINLLDQ